MAGLFTLFTISLLFLIGQKRIPAIVCIVLGIFLTLVMFWYHADSVLKINL